MLILSHSWVLLLAPLPLVVHHLIPARRRSRPVVRVPFLSRATEAQGSSGKMKKAGGRIASMIAPVLVWLLVLVSMARPQWLEPPIDREIPTRDLMVLVDLSASMSHSDFTDADENVVDRLTALKEVLGEFLLRREGDRVGLVVFGNAPFLQVPFTTDLDLCRELLTETEVGMAGPKTALGDAMGLAIQLFDNSDTPTKTVIALTDGNDTASTVPPAEAARVARDREITIHTIAMGDPVTVGEQAIDQQALREVAQTTGGDFFLALQRDELESVYKRLDEIEPRQRNSISYRPRRDVFVYPLSMALILSVLPGIGSLFSRQQISHVRRSARLRVNTRTFELEAVDH